MDKSPIRPSMFKGGFPHFALVLLIAGIFNLVLASVVEGKKVPLGQVELGSTLHVRGGGALGTATSDSFVVNKETRFLLLEYQTNLDNSWIGMDLSLFRTSDGKFVGSTAQGLEYYSGVEGGESWSEGSTRGSRIYRAPEPGTYQLTLTISEGIPRGRGDTVVRAVISSLPVDTNPPETLGASMLCASALLLLLSFIATRNPWDRDD